MSKLIYIDKWNWWNEGKNSFEEDERLFHDCNEKSINIYGIVHNNKCSKCEKQVPEYIINLQIFNIKTRNF